jgi:PhzF family phenazine biosynthesis protein
VDVFSTTAYRGNPLAIVDNTTSNLTTRQMQLISRQFNLSETTFFESPTKPKAFIRLRSFYPDGHEVFGSGHNILGVWWYLAQTGKLDYEKAEKVSEDTYRFYQELGTAVSPVNIVKSVDAEGRDSFSVTVRQDPPGFHNYHPDVAGLATSVGLEAKDLELPALHGRINPLEKSSTLKPRVLSISTTHHLLVPVASVEALNRVSVERDSLAHQLSLVDKEARGIYFFTPTPYDSTTSWQARFFSTGMSAEDPATGSAAGPLSAYLSEELKPENGKPVKIQVRQGLKTGRDCLIEVTLTKDGDALTMDITGSGAEVMEGSLTAPKEEAK